MSDWFVGKILTGSEGKLHTTFKEIGVESYYPTIKRKRRSPGNATRERYEEAALPGYLPIRAATVEAPETREKVYREAAFYDFLRDIDDVIAAIKDSELDPLRAMEKSEPVKFIAGPVFYIGEIIRVSYNNPHVHKSFWGMIGQVVSVRNGRYCLGGHDFAKETWFSGLQLLKPAV